LGERGKTQENVPKGERQRSITTIQDEKEVGGHRIESKTDEKRTRYDQLREPLW